MLRRGVSAFYRSSTGPIAGNALNYAVKEGRYIGNLRCFSSHHTLNSKYSRPLFDPKNNLKIDTSTLSDYKNQIHVPDTKSDCGIFACAMADSFSSFTVEELLRCPSDRLKARYHITDGGGDGGGIIAQSSPDELAKFYGCDARFFKETVVYFKLAFREMIKNALCNILN